MIVKLIQLRLLGVNVKIYDYSFIDIVSVSNLIPPPPEDTRGKKLIVFWSISDIDQCTDTPCQNNGTCTNNVSSYSCQCEDGYTGTTCDDLITTTTGNIPK
jgi:hypothetical protein